MRLTTSALVLAGIFQAGSSSSVASNPQPDAPAPVAFTTDNVHATTPTVAESTDPMLRLLEGNARFVSAHAQHDGQDVERRLTVAKGQHPFAVVVGCADSRVPPELVFDQGLGDLFVVRVAGNVMGDATIASIEYAVEHLGCELVVVLGHERCGAVDAVLKGGELPGHLPSLATAIAPACEEAKARGGADPLDEAVRANVRGIVRQLSACGPILSEATHTGKVRIIGGRYDLDDGCVDFFAVGAASAASNAVRTAAETPAAPNAARPKRTPSPSKAAAAKQPAKH